MAFTKIAAAGIGSTGTITLENVIVTGSVNASSITGAASTANIKTDSLVVSGVVTATSFSGDGSALTGIAATTNVRTDSLVVSGISTLGNTIVGGGTTELVVNGDARITGILTVGTSSITFNGNDNSVTIGTATTINSSGFSGSGASLTSLNASNITSGTLPDARFPATLPAVSGANLTNLPGGFAAGTLMLFQQTAAPTGWTKQTTHNNKALRVVSGTASSGGSANFTSIFTSRPISGSIGQTTVSGTVDNTTLSTTQIPSHSHNIGGSTPSVRGQFIFQTSQSNFFSTVENYNSSTGTVNSGSAGGGSQHNHSFSGSQHNHTFSATDLNFSVEYVDLIIASKD